MGVENELADGSFSLPIQNELLQCNSPGADPPVPPGAMPPLFGELLAGTATALDEGLSGVKATATLGLKMPVIPHAVDSAVVEHYRRLRTKLLQQSAIKRFRSLLIASASAQEGKTITVLNLALTYAMLPSFRLLVVDGDLRQGGLGKYLGLDHRPGLSNLIDGSTTEQEAHLDCSDIGFHVVVRGTSRTTPAELLQSEQLRKLLRRWEEQFDLVLIDSPPINLLTDTQLLADNIGAVLLVARAFTTRQKAFEKAIHDLSSCRLLGTVLNGSPNAFQMSRYHKYN
jgi:capsular exopolysaccharide synthesis family protein